jgi:hypothetical protein
MKMSLKPKCVLTVLVDKDKQRTSTLKRFVGDELKYIGDHAKQST